MKVTLDLDQLLASNQISAQEYEKLKALARESTSSTAFSILIGFGVIAVSGAALALVPSAYTAIIVGAVILISAIWLLKEGTEQWKVLAQICILVGALMLGGGILSADDGNARSFIAIAAIYAVSGVLAESGLLTVLAVLAIGPILGAGTGYSHATYMIAIQEPLLAIVVFSVLGIGLYYLAQHIPARYSRLAIIGARTSAFMVNLGFWIGSLWGEKFESIPEVYTSDLVFTIAWALALIAAGVWALSIQSRWLLNVVAVFAGIHFYTQWFERLGATPISVLIAGVIALAFAFVLKTINVKMVEAKTQ